MSVSAVNPCPGSRRQAPESSNDWHRRLDIQQPAEGTGKSGNFAFLASIAWPYYALCRPRAAGHTELSVKCFLRNRGFRSWAVQLVGALLWRVVIRLEPTG